MKRVALKKVRGETFPMPAADIAFVLPMGYVCLLHWLLRTRSRGFPMRCLVLAALLASVAVFAPPAEASLPYYNPDLGYTIWLDGGWSEAPRALLARFEGVEDGLAAQHGGWIAGYALAGSPRTCLLVSVIQGRVVLPTAIANFNRFVVRSMLRGEERATVRLKKANFLSARNMLRLEMDRADHMTSVVYLVYTRAGILKFTGFAPQGDAVAIQAIDRAVSTLYLDHGLGR